MSHDFGTLLFDPAHAILGVPATLTVGTNPAVQITVIDHTRPTSQTTSSLEVRGVAPGAFARIPELTAKGIERSNYDGASLSFNGRNWTVYSHEIRGSPNGEDQGDVRFLLKAAP